MIRESLVFKMLVNYYAIPAFLFRIFIKHLVSNYERRIFSYSGSEERS